MPILAYDRTVMPRKVDSPFLKGIKGPGGLVEEDEGRRKSKRAAAAKSGPPAGPGTGSLAAAVAANEAGPSPQLGSVALAGPSAAVGAKGPLDRSLTVAAGGRPALGGDPVIETLPEETSKCIPVFNFVLHGFTCRHIAVKHFDRDPRTGELLWFSGPPIQPINPQSFGPQYSLEYLAFLARKKAAADKERREREEREEEGEMETEEEEDARRKRMRSEDGRVIAPPTLRDAIMRDLGAV